MTDEEVDDALTALTNLWEYPYSNEARRHYNFCADLNAVHMIEKRLNYRQFETYIFELLEVQHEPMLASASERARALLIALKDNRGAQNE